MATKSIEKTAVAAGLVAAAFQAGAGAAENTRGAPPNVLFIVVDDLKPTLGCYGDGKAISPNIDKLAARGTVFLKAYCQQAICAPSRISFFTGLRPDTTKVWDFKTHMRDFNPNLVTLPEFFKRQGYETAGVGKLMHGAKNNDPRSWTIPYKWEHQLKYGTPYGYPANNGTYLGEAVKKLAEKIKGKKLTWAQNRDFFMNNKGRPSTERLDVPDNAYMDGAIADEGIRIMKQMAKSGKPFFLALGFRRPHLPFVAPEKYWKLYDGAKLEPAAFQKRALGSPDCAYHDSFELRHYSDIPPTGPIPPEKQRELVRGYYACVSYVDAQIGRILDELRALDRENDTVVVLLGDHGWHLGDHGLWCKQTNFEQATRAPLIISAPKYQKKQISDSVVEFIDIYPTVCQLAGFDPPENVQGTSLIPILENPDAKIAEYAVSQYPRDDKTMGYSLRTKRYRYTIWLPWSKKKGITSTTPAAVELYDYEKDPEEKTNLAGNPEYKGVAAKLDKKIRAFLEKEKSIP